MTMKVSIITVCFNSESYIEEAIQSVINQTYSDIEYIIVDGMSTDSTPQIIDKYKHNISKYIQGKDKNMYDAINKGMAVSTGEYIEILNSDDKLYDKHTIENVVKQIEKDKHSCGMYYGSDYIYYQDRQLLKYRPRIQTNYLELLCSKQLTFTGHGSVFLSRKVYETIGEYDCNLFKAAGDYDYMLRVMKNFKCKYLDVTIQQFRVHNSSITSSGAIFIEIDKVLEKNGYYKINPFVRSFYHSKGWSKFIIANFIPMCKYYFGVLKQSFG